MDQGHLVNTQPHYNFWISGFLDFNFYIFGKYVNPSEWDEFVRGMKGSDSLARSGGTMRLGRKESRG